VIPEVVIVGIEEGIVAELRNITSTLLSCVSRLDRTLSRSFERSCVLLLRCLAPSRVFDKGLVLWQVQEVRKGIPSAGSNYKQKSVYTSTTSYKISEEDSETQKSKSFPKPSTEYVFSRSSAQRLSIATTSSRPGICAHIHPKHTQFHNRESNISHLPLFLNK